MPAQQHLWWCSLTPSDMGGHCSVAPRMGFGVTRQRSYSTLWQALIFQVPLKGLVPFQTRRFKIFRRTWSTSGRRCRSKNFYGILLLEIPGFREASFPSECATVSCVFWVARLDRVGQLLKTLAQETNHPLILKIIFKNKWNINLKVTLKN